MHNAGAGLSVGPDPGTTDTNNGQNSGRVLLIIGLAGLVVLIFFFLATLVYVSRSATYRIDAPALRPVYAGLYITVALLLIRNIFRLIEFGQGWNGYIADHEVYFYVFDALTMLTWLIVVVPLHFGLLLRNARSQLGAISTGGVITDSAAGTSTASTPADGASKGSKRIPTGSISMV